MIPTDPRTGGRFPHAPEQDRPGPRRPRTERPGPEHPVPGRTVRGITRGGVCRAAGRGCRGLCGGRAVRRHRCRAAVRRGPRPAGKKVGHDGSDRADGGACGHAHAGADGRAGADGGPQLAGGRPTTDRPRLGPARLSVRTGAPRSRPGRRTRHTGTGSGLRPGHVRGPGGRARCAHHRGVGHTPAHHVRTGAGTRRDRGRGHRRPAGRGTGGRAVPLPVGLSALGAAARGRLSEPAVPAPARAAAPGTVQAAAGVRGTGDHRRRARRGIRGSRNGGGARSPYGKAYRADAPQPAGVSPGHRPEPSRRRRRPPWRGPRPNPSRYAAPPRPPPPGAASPRVSAGRGAELRAPRRSSR